MTEDTCAVTSCTRPRHCRGWCKPHYLRWLTRGDVAADQPLRLRGAPIYDRFMSHVDRTGGPDACHPWTGAANKAGYGLFRADYGSTLAHRWLLGHLLGRRLVESEEACHHCDNRPCCNPRDLYLGDRFTNMQDASRRGRMVGRRHYRLRNDIRG